MTMGAVSRRENGVLKLVHPGGFVEMHTNPISAAEIMRKNPRHCITRPDVFKFPWVVVRPESVLNPGRVFFIVPYHTIHRLLKSYGSRNQPSLPQLHQSLKDNQDQRPRHKQTSLFECVADQVTPKQVGGESYFVRRSRVSTYDEDENSKHQEHVVEYPRHDQYHKESYPVQSSVELTQFFQLAKKQSPNASRTKVNDHKHGERHARRLGKKYPVESGSKVMNDPNKNYHDHFHSKQSEIKFHAELKMQQNGGKTPKKQYPVERWPKANTGYKHYKQQIKPQTQVDSLVVARSFHSREHVVNDAQGRIPLLRNGGGLELESYQQVTKLKSCLKKHKNTIPNKSRGLRVTFASPAEDDKKLIIKVLTP